jgi:hypothetical protein
MPQIVVYGFYVWFLGRMNGNADDADAANLSRFFSYYYKGVVVLRLIWIDFSGFFVVLQLLHGG